MLLTDCSNFTICRSIRVMNLQWPGGFVNEGTFFRQFVNLQHLILKIPPEYLRRINFGSMDQLMTLEICRDLMTPNTENPFDSELSGGVSLSGHESEHCKGIDYANLQLPN